MKSEEPDILAAIAVSAGLVVLWLVGAAAPLILVAIVVKVLFF